MVRRHGHSGRRWRLDYLLAHLALFTFGKVSNLSPPSQSRASRSSPCAAGRVDERPVAERLHCRQSVLVAGGCREPRSRRTSRAKLFANGGGATADDLDVSRKRAGQSKGRPMDSEGELRSAMTTVSLCRSCKYACSFIRTVSLSEPSSLHIVS
jgi:hypothetical protein